MAVNNFMQSEIDRYASNLLKKAQTNKIRNTRNANAVKTTAQNTPKSGTKSGQSANKATQSAAKSTSGGLNLAAIGLPQMSQVQTGNIQSVLANIQNTQKEINTLSDIQQQFGSGANTLLAGGANNKWQAPTVTIDDLNAKRKETADKVATGLGYSSDKPYASYLGEKAAGGAASTASGTINALNDINYFNETYQNSNPLASLSSPMASAIRQKFKNAGITPEKVRDTVRDSDVVKGLNDYTSGIDERYDNPTGAASLGGTVSNILGAEIPSWILNGIIPGGGYVLQGLSSAGNAAAEARAEGATENEALLYGATTGTVEGLVEKFSGGILGTGGNSFIDKALKKGLENKALNTAAKQLITKAADVVGEGWEEWLTATLDPYFKRIYNEDDRGVIQTFIEKQPEAFTAGLLGMLASGVMQVGSAPGAIVNSVRTNNAGADIQQSGQLGSVISAGLNSTDADVRTEAQRMAQKVTEGGTVKNSEAGSLYRQLRQMGEIAGLPIFENINAAQNESSPAQAAQSTPNAGLNNIVNMPGAVNTQQNAPQAQASAQANIRNVAGLPMLNNQQSSSTRASAVQQIRDIDSAMQQIQQLQGGAQQNAVPAAANTANVQQNAPQAGTQNIAGMPIPNNAQQSGTLDANSEAIDILPPEQQAAVRHYIDMQQNALNNYNAANTQQNTQAIQQSEPHTAQAAAQSAAMAIDDTGTSISAPAQQTQRTANTAQQSKPTTYDIEKSYVNLSPEGHTAEQQKTIEEYKRAVNPAIIDFVNEARANGKTWKRLEIGEVKPREAADIKRITGIDTTGYKRGMAPNAIEHIDKRHTKAGAERQDESMNNIEDIARIEWVLDNYDKMEISLWPSGDIRTTSAFQNSDGSDAQTVKYSKALDGTFYVIEAVPESKAKKIQLISAYINRNKTVNKKELQVSDAMPQTVRPKTKLAYSSNENIPSSEANVNTSAEKTSQANKTAAQKTPKVRNIDDLKADSTPQNKRKTEFELATQQLIKDSGVLKQQAVTRRTEPPKPAQGESKAKRVQAQRENNFVNKVGEAFSVPGGARREYLRPIAQEMSAEIKKNGRVSDETAQRLFDTAWDKGVIIEKDFAEQYADLKKNLREVALTLDRDSRNSREYRDMRNRYFGTLNLTNSGTPVDVKYMELSESYPELFDSEIVAPLDQLERIGEVAKSIRATEITLDAYYGGYIDDFKNDTRPAFDKAINELEQGIKNVDRYEADIKAREEQKAKILAQDAPHIEYEQVKSAYDEAAKLRRKADNVASRELLTDADKKIVDKLLRGDIDVSEIKSENKAGIINVYKARKAAKDALAPVKEYQAAWREHLNAQAENAVAKSDAWKDKKIGLQYSTETMERNMRDIIKDRGEAESIIKEYITPVHKHEAEATRFKNDLRAQIKALKLNQQESEYMQIYGELKGLEAAQKQGLRRGATELEQLQKAAADYLKENKAKIDTNKIEKGLKTFRTVYDNLFDRMNEAYVQNGYAPVQYRAGYFPHFQEQQAASLGARILSKFGVDTTADTLPTNIAGLTYQFKPGRRYNPHTLERTGTETTYDALKGFDQYLEVAADVIYHTEDIRKLRALEEAIRFKNSAEGAKIEREAIYNNDMLTDEQKEVQLQALRDKSIGHLGNFVQELNEYTNVLAGKKSMLDRSIERLAGRAMYKTMQKLENRVAANMVAINPGSWLTNFIPLTQAGAECSTGSMLKAARDTVKAYAADDGFIDSSVFLTNRRGSEALSKTTTRKISEALSSPMTYIDDFASSVITRAKYLDNIKAGMDAASAMDNADAYAASLMADRSKGALPTVFHSKNPLMKTVTMFQTEANNQLRYLFKDLPQNLRDKGIMAMVQALMKYTIGAYLFNDLYEKLVGRRPALDPIGTINEFIGDATGAALPNVADAVGSLLKGENVSFTATKQKAGTAAANLITNAGGELPFVGGLLFDGGRLPISSALGNPITVGETAINMLTGSTTKEKGLEKIRKEIVKPAFYMLPPFGGGQLKKIVEGVSTVAQGGEYGYDSDGNRTLKYEVDSSNPLNYAQAMLFGRYSLPGAQEYVKSGFNDKGAKYTAAYEEAKENGMDTKKFDSIWNTLDADKSGTIAMGEASKGIVAADISDEEKAMLWRHVASDSKLEKYAEAEKAGAGTQYALAAMQADADGNGSITAKEAEAYLKQAVMSQKVKKLMFSLLSTAKNNPFE